MYINQNLNNFDHFNRRFHNTRNEDENPETSDQIIILKKVNSIRQIKNREKEWVRLCYKEAILKGFSVINDIQRYIASKTKIWIERSGIEYLKKSEEEENKKWYFDMAKDHFVYVGVHRRAIDEIEQCKKELWTMMANSRTTNSEKVQIIKELHNLTKTYTLLLRDLPFVTNLSKYYNLEFSDPKFKDEKRLQYNQTDKDSKDDKELIEQMVSERLRKMIEQSALFNSEQKNKMGITSSPDGDTSIDDPVMLEMQKQLNPNSKDVHNSFHRKDFQDSVKKLKEIRED